MSSVSRTAYGKDELVQQTAHARYRPRLVALATNAAICRALAQADQQRAWWPTHTHWSRMYEQFHPDQQPFATLVFAAQGRPQALCHIDICEVPPRVHSADDHLVLDATVGWMRLRRFPVDTNLTTIKAVLAA